MGYFRMRRDLSVPIAPMPMPAGVAVRMFDASTALGCHALLDAAYDDQIGFDDWYAWLTGDAEYDATAMWVAEDSGRAVGFCHCWSVPYVKDLVVDSSWRQRGLGGALLTLALEEFALRGASSIDLKTDIDNLKAQSLYKRLGFVIVERVD